MKKTHALLSIFFLLLVLGANGADARESETGAEGGFLKRPLAPTLVELPPDALPLWRKGKGHSTLVILTHFPLLDRIPSTLKQEASRLASSGTADELRDKARRFRSDPTLLPSQTLSAALGAGLFTDVLWVIPTNKPPGALSLTSFQKNLKQSGIASQEEIESFSQEAESFSGRVRGVPFRAVHPKAIPSLEGHTILHIDLSFFSQQYENEVSTPLYPMLHDHLRALEKSGIEPSQVVISLSTEEGEVPLELRHLGPTLAKLVKSPDLLEKSLPPLWELRSRVNYLKNFFQVEEVLKLYQEMLKRAPNDPAVHYGMSQIHRTLRNGDQSLHHLDKAAELDRGYSRAYVELGMSLFKKGIYPTAYSILSKAHRAFPKNPLLSLQLVETCLFLGRTDTAREHLEYLKTLDWSPFYYPEIPEAIRRFDDRLRETSTKEDRSQEVQKGPDLT